MLAFRGVTAVTAPLPPAMQRVPEITASPAFPSGPFMPWLADDAPSIWYI